MGKIPAGRGRLSGDVKGAGVTELDVVGNKAASVDWMICCTDGNACCKTTSNRSRALSIKIRTEPGIKYPLSVSKKE